MKNRTAAHYIRRENFGEIKKSKKRIILIRALKEAEEKGQEEMKQKPPTFEQNKCGWKFIRRGPCGFCPDAAECEQQYQIWKAKNK